MSFQGNRINPSSFSKGQIKYYLILVPLALLYVLPIIYIVVTAFKPMNEIFVFPPRFTVQNPTLDNFTELGATLSSGTISFSRYVINSLLSTLLVVIGSVLISLMMGYALAKRRFRAAGALRDINNLAMMFVPVAVTIPRYIILERLGVVNTFMALVLPLIAMPVGMFLLTQFISDIPDSLLEAARIDGANEWTILLKIVAPIVRPALATVGILAFQSAWNATEPSATFISNDLLRTMPFYLNALVANQGNSVAGAGMMAAATLVMFVPNLIVFILMQKSVLNTMAHSGIK